jgi:hypothetical protein
MTLNHGTEVRILEGEPSFKVDLGDYSIASVVDKNEMGFNESQFMWNMFGDVRLDTFEMMFFASQYSSLKGICPENA